MMYFDRLHTKRKTLRDALIEKAVFAPCVYNCFTAQIVEQLGFDAMCFSGAYFASSYVGVPDIGLVTPTEVKNMVSNIVKVSNVPMIVDMDTGYGNELNAVRTAVDFAEAGAMALHLEDQVFPKRCGHLNGKKVVPRDEYIRKIRAVADALKGSDCLLIARTDAALEFGVEEAIERNKRSLEAGADIAFTEGTRSIDDIERVAREVDGWNMFDMCKGGASPNVPFEDLVQMGYRLVTCPTVCSIVCSTFDQVAGKAFETKNDAFVAEYDATPESFFRTLGIQSWMELGQKYDANMKDATVTTSIK